MNYLIREDIFEKILYDFESDIITKKDNFEEFIYGYNDNKKKLVYDGRDTLILPEYILNYYIDTFEFCTSWKQCQIRRAPNTDVKISRDIHGSEAEKYMNKILRDFYTEAEIDQCLKDHEAEYDPDYKQLHYTYPGTSGKLYVYANTYRYDINKAHLDALCEIFPKASKRLSKLAVAKTKEKKDLNKKIANYYVGRLGKWQDKKKTIPGKYRKTYNWIVQRTTKILLNAIDKADGQLLYANTDGFIVSDPNNLLGDSKILGKFKEEYHGPTYIYTDKNYILYQTNKKVGSCLCEVRDQIDLSKHEVVHYNIEQGKQYRKAVNITKEKLNEEDCYENL